MAEFHNVNFNSSRISYFWRRKVLEKAQYKVWMSGINPYNVMASCAGGVKINAYSGAYKTAGVYIPVIAAVAVRKKVVSIGHFSQSSCHCKSFYLLDKIKSNCMY